MDNSLKSEGLGLSSCLTKMNSRSSCHQPTEHLRGISSGPVPAACYAVHQVCCREPQKEKEKIKKNYQIWGLLLNNANRKKNTKQLPSNPGLPQASMVR